MDLDAEFAVVGLGTMGSMAFWRLASAGASVIGLEQFTPGHDRSAAGGESRQFRSRLLEPFVLDHLQIAERLYRELERHTGAELLRLTGGLTIGAPGSEIIESTLARSEAEQYPVEVLDASELRRRYPQHRATAEEIALFDDASGYIRPEFAVTTAVRAGVSAGGRVADRTRVLGVREEDDHVVVTTGHRDYRVRRAIVTAGPWAPELGDLRDARTHVRRILMTWFPAADPAEFAPEVFPTWSIALEDGAPAFGLPTLDGGSVKVAVVESYGDFQEADALDHSIRPDELTRVCEVVRDRLPGLMPAPVRQSVHMDLYTADEQPLVGLQPGAERIFIAAGFSGRGFKYAPAIGETLARAVRGDDSLLLPEWDPARRIPVSQDAEAHGR